jgi:hypothetical protein
MKESQQNFKGGREPELVSGFNTDYGAGGFALILVLFENDSLFLPGQ